MLQTCFSRGWNPSPSPGSALLRSALLCSHQLLLALLAQLRILQAGWEAEDPPLLQTDVEWLLEDLEIMGATEARISASAACAPLGERSWERGVQEPALGRQQTPGNDPGAAEKAEYLLPLGELMTLLASVTVRLGTCQKSSRFPRLLPCFCSFSCIYFRLWKLSFSFCPFVLVSLSSSPVLALPLQERTKGLGRWGGVRVNVRVENVESSPSNCPRSLRSFIITKWGKKIKISY